MSIAQFGLQVTNPQSEIIKKIDPTHIASAIEHQHELNLRRVTYGEKELAQFNEEAVRIHERDNRDRTERGRENDRLERVFYVLFGTIVVLMGILILKGEYEIALKLFGGAAFILCAVLGGMGIESVRRERKKKKGASEEDDDAK